MLHLCALYQSLALTNTLIQYYKLNGDAAVSALQKEPSKQNVKVDEIVCSFVAMKSVMS